MELILDFENNGLCMAVDEQFLYVGSKGAISKYSLDDMSLAAHISVNNTKKKTIYNILNFQIFGEYIFVTDFCDLHLIKKNDLQLLYTVRLGEDVSSDIISVIDFNSPNAYVSIRNGRIILLDIQTKKAARFEISGSTNWSSSVIGNRLYCSTAKGELLEIEKDPLQVIRKVQLTKKMNIYSVVPCNDMLYTTSERGFKVVDINTFEIVRIVNDVFRSTEANIAGTWGGAFVIVERKRAALFDIQTLELRERFDFPTGYRHMRYALLRGDKLYGSDEHGIYCRILN